MEKRKEEKNDKDWLLIRGYRTIYEVVKLKEGRGVDMKTSRKEVKVKKGSYGEKK